MAEMMSMQEDAALAEEIGRRLAEISIGALGDPAECLALCRKAMASGRAGSVIPLLALLHGRFPKVSDIASHLGYALRQEQRFSEAEAIFADAATTSGTDSAIAFGLAQTRYELGLPAAALFAAAEALLPGNGEVVRNRAAAMAAEGDVAGAEALLESALLRQPGWLDGHKGLATLRWTRGNKARFAESYADACKSEPHNAGLWLAWFHAVAQSRDWHTSMLVLNQAEQRLGNTPAIQVCRLFVACEAGDVKITEKLLAQSAHIQGDTANLCRIRHYLRRGRLKEAQDVALGQLLSPSANLYWPYLSIVWRLMGDERWLWLDRPDALVQACDVDLSVAELFELAEVLRGLHVMERPYVEQSVRGGTQTDRSVILRHEPILQKARIRWLESIRAYVERLPPFEQGHPLLGAPRHHLLVEGSWSVRLLQQGYNVPHTHPMGWLSTAFYIALPDPSAAGPAPAGYIAFGVPPRELALDLQPYAHIQPKVGQTAIFPSTTWHGTIPFQDGERLVLALDIRTPRY